MMNQYERTARVFKALGDENRIHILELLTTGEKCGCKLLETLEVTQPTLSHHMKILCDSELVSSRKDGKMIRYSISEEGVARARGLLESATRRKPCAEASGCAQAEE